MTEFDDDGPEPLKQRYAPLRRDLANGRAAFERSVESGDAKYGYVALAVGEWAASKRFPAGAPKWAIEACLALYESAEMATTPIVGTAKGPQRTPEDEQKLERIADIFIDYEVRAAEGFASLPTERAVVRHVLGIVKGEPDDANVRRLWRKWRHDKDHRKTRAKIRLHRKFEERGLLWPIPKS